MKTSTLIKWLLDILIKDGDQEIKELRISTNDIVGENGEVCRMEKYLIQK